MSASNPGWAQGYVPTPTQWNAEWALKADVGAIARNVKNYGATGNGTTDDTGAIQAALTAAAGGALYLPAGQYLISNTLLISSTTLLYGDGPGSVLLAAPGITATGQHHILANINQAATTLTDHDISVERLMFDYGASGMGGAGHAAHFAFCKDVVVKDCDFQCRGAGDAIAFVGCYDTTAEGCRAYGFSNCAYDHWWGPTNSRIVNCYAETASSVQVVNWNPEPTSGPATGLAATGLVLDSNEFVSTRATAIPCQIEPLGAGTTVADTTIVGNNFTNVYLSMRGGVRGAVISGNTFASVAGGVSVIQTYTLNSASPSEFIVTGNIITDPATASGNLGVIRISTDTALIAGNRISGTAFGSVAGIYTVGFAPTLYGNYVSNGTIASPLGTAGDSVTVPNSKYIGWLDTAGSPIRWLIQSDNNHLFYGTDNTGTQRMIFAIQQRSAASAFRVGPAAQIGVSLANFVALQGAATGSPSSVMAQGADTNLALSLNGQGSKGVLFGAASGSAAPAAGTDVPAGQAVVWKNTTSGAVGLFYNDGGTMKSVTLV